MSNPGQSQGNDFQPLTMQQALEFQKQQQMAQALMGNSANPTTPYAGVANAGGDLAGAVQMKKALNNANWAQQGIAPVNITPNQMTGQGGSNSMFQNGMAGLKNLFSMGG